MIHNADELRNSSEALSELYAALDALRREHEAASPQTFALLAEGPLKEIDRIRREMDIYVGISDALRDQASLWMRLVGPKAKWGETSSSVVIAYLDSLRRGIQAIASHGAARVGRPPSELREACDFEITAFSAGSFEVGVRLPTSEAREGTALQAQKAAHSALHDFLAAAAAISHPNSSHTELAEVIPQSGLRRAVLLALKPFIPRSHIGVDYIELFGSEVRYLGAIRLTPKATDAISEALRESNEEQEVVYEGHIREMDLDKHAFMLRGVSPSGQVRCDFSEEMLATATALLGCRVRVTGTRLTKGIGKARRMFVTDLEEVESQEQR